MQTLLNHHKPHRIARKGSIAIFHHLAQKTQTKIQKRAEPIETRAKNDPSIFQPEAEHPVS
jgi:hypothetical protein